MRWEGPVGIQHGKLLQVFFLVDSIGPKRLDLPFHRANVARPALPPCQARFEAPYLYQGQNKLSVAVQNTGLDWLGR